MTTSMPSSVRLAVAQIDIRSLDKRGNVAKLVEFSTRAAREEGANIVVLPELADLGYIKQRDREFGGEYIAAADPADGLVLDALAPVCRQHDCWIVVGVAELHPTVPSTLYNTALVIGPDGLRGVYRKIHLPGEEKHYFAAGASVPVFETDFGTLGVSICYDTFFPELARAYALKGAHFVVCPTNAGGRNDHPDTLRHLATSRAMENKLFVATCNRVGVEGDVQFIGRSVVADPFGNIVAELADREELAVVELDGVLLRAERAFHPFFADRRPELYGELSAPIETNTDYGLVQRVGPLAR